MGCISINNEQYKDEIKKINSIYNSMKKNKILRNKLCQEGERLVQINSKTLMKEIKEGINKCRVIQVHGLESLILPPKGSILTMQFLSKSHRRSCRNRKTHLHITMESQGTLKSRDLDFKRELMNMRAMISKVT